MTDTWKTRAEKAEAENERLRGVLEYIRDGKKLNHIHMRRAAAVAVHLREHEQLRTEKAEAEHEQLGAENERLRAALYDIKCGYPCLGVDLGEDMEAMMRIAGQALKGGE